MNYSKPLVKDDEKQSRYVPAFYDDLDASFAYAWQLMTEAVRNRHSLFHTPSVATIGADGAPQNRVVVLRGAERKARNLRFHTDLRSGKIVDLKANPNCAMLFYDPKVKLQLRVTGKVAIHNDDDIEDAAWAGSRPQSRACYTQGLAPGVSIESPLDAPLAPPADNPDLGKENFCAVLLRAERIEWLYLHSGGHRRAVWHFDDGQWRGEWLAT